MNKQMTLSLISDELAQASTRKKEFLAVMDRMIPWPEWAAMVTPCYYQGERGNKPCNLELMLRIHILQKLYNLEQIVDSTWISALSSAKNKNEERDPEAHQVMKGNKTDLCGGSGYLGSEKKENAVQVNKNGESVQYHINLRPSQMKKFTGAQYDPFGQRNTPSPQPAAKWSMYYTTKSL